MAERCRTTAGLEPDKVLEYLVLHGKSMEHGVWDRVTSQKACRQYSACIQDPCRLRSSCTGHSWNTLHIRDGDDS